MQIAGGMAPGQFIPDRGLGKEDRISGVIFADAPAVEDDQQNATLAAPILTGSKRRTIHGNWLLKPKGGKDRRCHISQFAIAQAHS